MKIVSRRFIGTTHAVDVHLLGLRRHREGRHILVEHAVEPGVYVKIVHMKYGTKARGRRLLGKAVRCANFEKKKKLKKTN